MHIQTMKLETEDLMLGFPICVILVMTWIGFDRYNQGLLLAALFAAICLLLFIVKFMPSNQSKEEIQPELNEVKQEIEAKPPQASIPAEQPEPVQEEPVQTEPIPQAMFLQCPPVPEIQTEPIPKKKRHRRKRKRKTIPKEVDPIAFREPDEPQPMAMQIPDNPIQDEMPQIQEANE